MMIFFQQIIQRKAKAANFSFIFKRLIKRLSISIRQQSVKGNAQKILFFYLYASISLASNYDIEKNISDQLQESLPRQEIVWLDNNGKPQVLALFKPSTQNLVNGGAIILHNFDTNPDWPKIIHPLRNYLPKYNWATLSIQMPTSPDEPTPHLIDDLFQNTRDRINAGIAYLQAKNIEPIVIIAHGKTASMALKYAANEEFQNNFASIIVISAYDQPYLTSSDFVTQIPNNILDIVAENDWSEVLLSAKKRLRNANLAQELSPPPVLHIKSEKVKSLILRKTGNLRYRQEIITGANHSYAKQSDELLKTIRGWMNKYHN